MNGILSSVFSQHITSKHAHVPRTPIGYLAYSKIVRQPMNNLANQFMANVRPLSDALARRAAIELNEVPDQIPYYIHTLREWLKSQLHLRTPLNDQFLIAFLRGNKYDLENTKRKIDLFFTVRDEIPEVMKNRDPLRKEIDELLRLGTTIPLPLPIGEDGPRIHIIRSRSFAAQHFGICDVFKVSTIITDIMTVDDDNFIIGGSVGILDLGKAMHEHLHQIDMISVLMKKLTRLSVDAQPFQVISFHYINVPDSFDAVFSLIKGFMSEEYRMKFYVHRNFESLYKFVPQHLLPTEYGGSVGSIQEIVTFWHRKILEHRDSILEWDHYGINERYLMRPPPPPPPLASSSGRIGSGTSEIINIDD